MSRGSCVNIFGAVIVVLVLGVVTAFVVGGVLACSGTRQPSNRAVTCIDKTGATAFFWWEQKRGPGYRTYLVRCEFPPPASKVQDVHFENGTVSFRYFGSSEDDSDTITFPNVEASSSLAMVQRRLPPTRTFTHVITCGWPLAMLYQFTPDGEVGNKGFLQMGHYQIPANPIWSSIAVDSAFYAGHWTVPLFACRWLLKRRRRSGSCSKCGYDLGGLTRGAPCPECGTPAPAPTATP